MSDQQPTLAWQRWSLPNLAVQTADQPAEKPAAIVGNALHNEDVEQQITLLRQQAEQQGFNQGLERGMQQGQQQGYQAGHTEGYNAGQQQGLLEAQQSQQKLSDQLQDLVTSFQQALNDLDKVIPGRLLQIALTAARQVIGQAPVCDGSALLAQISQLLHDDALLGENRQLWLHPEDMILVEQRLGSAVKQQGWRLCADSQLHRGGCRITDQAGEWDASLATRWSTLCQLSLAEGSK